MNCIHVKSNSPIKGIGHTQSLQGCSHIRTTPLRQQQVTVSPNFLEEEKVKQNEKVEELLSVEKLRKKPPEKINYKTETNNLPEKEFETLVIKTLIELGKTIDKQSENFNNEIENKTDPTRSEEFIS